MNEFLAQYGTYVWYVGGVMLLGIVITVIFSRRNKNKANKYLQEHPDAVRVFLHSKTSIASEAVQVYLVNGQNPVLFSEKGKGGFYALPGNVMVQISYTHNRPGVMYKNVTKTTGAVERELVIEPNKTYKLSFDRKENDFVFAEI